MGIIRRIFFFFYHFINAIALRLNKVQHAKLEIFGILLIHNKGRIAIGDSSRINSSKYKNIIGGDTRSSIIVKKGAELSIGRNFRMSNSAIYCAEKIVIGNNVMMGGSCKLWDTNFHPMNSFEREGNPNTNYKTAPIIIGNNVFIGGGCIILKGISIGDGAILAAGSVVARDIPPGEIWGGNPARFIKKSGNENT